MDNRINKNLDPLGTQEICKRQFYWSQIDLRINSGFPPPPLKQWLPKFRHYQCVSAVSQTVIMSPVFDLWLRHIFSIFAHHPKYLFLFTWAMTSHRTHSCETHSCTENLSLRRSPRFCSHLPSFLASSLPRFFSGSQFAHQGWSILVLSTQISLEHQSASLEVCECPNNGKEMLTSFYKTQSRKHEVEEVESCFLYPELGDLAFKFIWNTSHT